MELEPGIVLLEYINATFKSFTSTIKESRFIS